MTTPFRIHHKLRRSAICLLSSLVALHFFARPVYSEPCENWHGVEVEDLEVYEDGNQDPTIYPRAQLSLPWPVNKEVPHHDEVGYNYFSACKIAFCQYFRSESIESRILRPRKSLRIGDGELIGYEAEIVDSEVSELQDDGFDGYDYEWSGTIRFVLLRTERVVDIDVLLRYRIIPSQDESDIFYKFEAVYCISSVSSTVGSQPEE